MSGASHSPPLAGAAPMHVNHDRMPLLNPPGQMSTSAALESTKEIRAACHYRCPGYAWLSGFCCVYDASNIVFSDEKTQESKSAFRNG